MVAFLSHGGSVAVLSLLACSFLRRSGNGNLVLPPFHDYELRARLDLKAFGVVSGPADRLVLPVVDHAKLPRFRFRRTHDERPGRDHHCRAGWAVAEDLSGNEVRIGTRARIGLGVEQIRRKGDGDHANRDDGRDQPRVASHLRHESTRRNPSNPQPNRPATHQHVDKIHSIYALARTSANGLRSRDVVCEPGRSQVSFPQDIGVGTGSDPEVSRSPAPSTCTQPAVVYYPC